MNITKMTLYQTLRKAGSTREDAIIDVVEVIADEMERSILFLGTLLDRKGAGETVSEDDFATAILAAIHAWARATGVKE